MTAAAPACPARHEQPSVVGLFDAHQAPQALVDGPRDA